MKNNIILIATTNKGKLSEFELILKGAFKEVNFISLADVFYTKPPKEIYDTFTENAKLKADFYFNQYNMPVIVEDSGFCVEALNNLPGVHSADWGEGKDFTKGIEKLYKMLNGLPSKAFFTSTIIYKDFEKELIAKGKVWGTVAQIPKGENGFGFDPCFVPNGFDKTFAEMTKQEKSTLSHRKLALTDLIGKI